MRDYRGEIGTAYTREEAATREYIPTFDWTSGIFSPRVAIPDNKPFLDLFDADAFIDRIRRPTKTVIVSQDPAPGDYLPAGSHIAVTTVVKDLIPTDIFTGISTAVVEKFDEVGPLVEAIDKSPVKAVLAKDVPYEDLSQGEKVTVDQFLTSALGVQNPTEETRAKLHSDVKFFFDL